MVFCPAFRLAGSRLRLYKLELVTGEKAIFLMTDIADGVRCAGGLAAGMRLQSAVFLLADIADGKFCTGGCAAGMRAQIAIFLLACGAFSRL